jgi:hypothetical protein
MNILPYVPPEQMTPRARAYLSATALYCIGMGIACGFYSELFNSASFTVIRRMLPGQMAGWAAAHFLVASLSVWAALRGKESTAWKSLMGATAMVGPWAGGFWLALFTMPHIVPSGAIAYSFITVIHLIQARQPLRSPFEPVMRQLENEM